MQTKRRIIEYVLGAGLLCTVTAAGVATGLKTEGNMLTSITQISNRCQRNIGADGFGHAVIGDANISGQSGVIAQPCKVRLKAGSTLQLNNVHLETKNLLIEDSPLIKRPSHMVINNTSLVSPVGGLQIKLGAAKSTVAVKNSLFSYALSVGISVGQTDKDFATILNVNNSVFRSKSPDTEGIVLVSTGQAIVRQSRFESSATGGQALLLGTQCTLVDNSGANQQCQGE